MGVLVIDKPPGPTSFDVVRTVRRELEALWGRRKLRVGHGGTLDPMASGVLPVCVGEATKIAPFVLAADKAYEAMVRLGVETDTLDATGREVARQPVPPLDVEVVTAALARFLGEIDQVPPMYSALKRQGQPLYRYARRGETVDRPPRRVLIHELALVRLERPDRLHLRVRCSKGTYVRSLAADLGRALGPGGHLEALRRTASGPFRLDQALSPEDFTARARAGQPLPFVSVAEALSHLPAALLDEDAANALGHGKRLPWASLGLPGEVPGPLRALRPDGTLAAVVVLGSEGNLRILRGFGRE